MKEYKDNPGLALRIPSVGMIHRAAKVVEEGEKVAEEATTDKNICE